MATLITTHHAQTGPGGGADAAAQRSRRRLVVRGIVQGVGFRPFVWNTADRLGLSGYVCNTSGAVVIEVEGEPSALDEFALLVRDHPPPLAQVRSIDLEELDPSGETGFRIERSITVEGEHQPISPDAATCAACLGELFDPGDRRHRYPFLNCTDCGPRFTIIEDVPYDRPLTTMRRFTMCAACQREYDDPRDRRFHAQPNACPVCGPRLRITDSRGTPLAGDPLTVAVSALGGGGIVAVKGLGGFQLSCDAADDAAVARLRERKRRPSKPFAVMVADLAAARAIADLSPEAAAVLESSARPVVLLPRRHDAAVAPSVAPGLDELGVLLPATPLHHLLLHDSGRVLVMTSGNVTEEPIAKDDGEAIERLGGIADLLLLHDREIYARYDDSVVRLASGAIRMIRRARGYSPLPIAVGDAVGEDVLALGGHLKNTFCVLRSGQAFLGPHIGDLDTPLTLQHHDESLRTYLRLFRARPGVVACDMHPDYASTRLAEDWWARGATPARVQHHHAHIASVLAEHGARGRVLGIALDGTGWGPDGTVWGGELLLCDEASYVRVGHLAPVPQPGGDLCAREGWRMAASYLEAGGRAGSTPPAWLNAGLDERRWRLVTRVARSRTAPLSSSAGRLFDAVASLLDIAHSSTYEAEAAIRLEALAASVEIRAMTPWPVAMAGTPLRIDTVGLVASLVDERVAGRPVDELAATFHESLARALAAAASMLAVEAGVRRVALSGGCFQNRLILGRIEELLAEDGLEVLTNGMVPANDGGLSLGQALVAASLARLGLLEGEER